jgi:hypothetical protein
MSSLRRRVALLITAVSLWAAGTASAGQIAFDFSSLNVNSSNASISSLMTSQAGSTVTVTGAQVNTNYTGDGHVVGPKIGSTIVPWTLGDSGGTVSNPTAPTTTNPTYKPYLANAVPGGPNGSSTTITMKFNTPIYAVTFDFEIFPDGTWDPNNPTQNVPDFEFSATDSTNHVVAAKTNGSMTALPWVVYGVSPGSVDPYLPGNPTTYTHSTVSGTTGTENVPQLIGAVTFVFSTNDPATSLTFADWPQQIGINNLIINPNGVTPFTTTVPAPPSAMLLGFGAIGVLGFVARSRRRQPAMA